MPAPYSDDLYSGHGPEDVSDDEQHDALSPTDGYFHASSTVSNDAGPTSSSSSHDQHQRQSSNVPFVPNVMVEDPTLRQHAKAREAEQERLINNTGGDYSSSLSNVAQTQPTLVTSAPVNHQPRHYYDPYPHHFYSPSQSQSQSVTYPHPYPQSHQASSSTIPPTATTSPPPTSPTHYHRRSIDEQVSSVHFEPSNAAGPSTNHYTVQQQRDAPPAYSPSPSSPPPSSGYQTFTPPRTATATYPAAMGLREEQQALLHRQPESMGGLPNGSRPPVWRRLKDSTDSPTLRRKIRTLLGVLVIISIVFALIGGITIGSGPDNHNIVDKTPVKQPATGDNGKMEWKPATGCLNTPHKFPKTNEVITFGNKKSLTVTQKIEKDSKDSHGTAPRVYGDIILKPVDASSTGNIDLEIITNDQNQRVEVKFDERSQRFEVITPRRVDWADQRQSPCIQIRIVVSVPRESNLQFLDVEATQLDVSIKDGLVLSSSEGVSIASVSGDVRTGRSTDDLVPYTLASRRISVETVSGDIDGWFPLYDSLKLHTVSGNIGTNVTPKPSSDKNPEKAALEVISVSGEVLVTERLEPVSIGDDSKLPLRDYVVDISTVSGLIAADVAFTSHAKFKSQSGDFKINLLPLFYFDSGSDFRPLLETDTKSGNTNVFVAEPVWKSSPASIGDFDPMAPPSNGNDDESNPPQVGDEPWIIIHPDEKLNKVPPKLDINPHSIIGNAEDKDPGLTSLTSRHSSISGDFKVTYPSSWEGKFCMSTISGGQIIQGDDLKYSRTGGILKRIQGTKGNGKSDLTLASTSGTQDLAIGRGY